MYTPPGRTYVHTYIRTYVHTYACLNAWRPCTARALSLTMLHPSGYYGMPGGINIIHHYVCVHRGQVYQQSVIFAAKHQHRNNSMEK